MSKKINDKNEFNKDKLYTLLCVVFGLMLWSFFWGLIIVEMKKAKCIKQENVRLNKEKIKLEIKLLKQQTKITH